jgi:hypothetical protein
MTSMAATWILWIIRKCVTSAACSWRSYVTGYDNHFTFNRLCVAIQLERGMRRPSTCSHVRLCWSDHDIAQRLRCLLLRGHGSGHILKSSVSEGLNTTTLISYPTGVLYAFAKRLLSTTFATSLRLSTRNNATHTERIYVKFNMYNL